VAEVLQAGGGRQRGVGRQQRRLGQRGPAAAGQVSLEVGAGVGQRGGAVEAQQAGLVANIGGVGQRRHRHAAGRAVGGQRQRRLGGRIGGRQGVVERQRAFQPLA